MTANSSVPWRAHPKTIYVVLPAFNEAANLGALVEAIDNAMWEDALKYEIILVDDGSRDETAEVVKKYQEQLPIRYIRHESNMGLGVTIRDGLQVAAVVCRPGDIVVAMDADNSHTPGLIRSMVRKINEGSDVVIASRFRPGSFVRGVPWWRVMLSYCARILFQLAFPSGAVRDYTCGYRAYKAELLKAAFKRYGTNFVERDGFEAMLDILLKLRTMDAIFSEVPLILRYDQKKGNSKMNVLRTIRRSLTLLIERRFLSEH